MGDQSRGAIRRVPVRGGALDSPERLGPDTEFIGAGDEIVVLDGTHTRVNYTGILVDADGEKALVRRDTDNKWVTEKMGDLAHPDSPLVEGIGGAAVAQGKPSVRLRAHFEGLLGDLDVPEGDYVTGTGGKAGLILRPRTARGWRVEHVEPTGHVCLPFGPDFLSADDLADRLRFSSDALGLRDLDKHGRHESTYSASGVGDPRPPVGSCYVQLGDVVCGLERGHDGPHSFEKTT